MGPKYKRKIVRERISGENEQERKRELARASQRRRRARLIGGEAEEKEWIESDIVGFGSSKTFQGTPEEISVEVDIKEECFSDDGDEKIDKGNMEEPESELLPGFKGQQLFYDGVGYYYTQLYEDATYRWLTCSHSDCSVMAQMKRHNGAPIRLVTGVPQHTHLPNPARRDRLLFLHTIKTRHANENTPFSEIFQQEAHKNPVGASFFSFDKIQAHLQKKISSGGSESLSQESVLSAASQLSMMTRGRPSPDEEPVTKKMRTDDDPPLSGRMSKKLQLLKSLKDVSFTECQITEPATPPPTKPSERLPGPHPHSYVYHDGYGYYYKPLSISGNTRYLHCNSVGCGAQAVMALEENAPITLESDSPAHNHPPQAETSTLSSPGPVKITLSSGGQKKTVNLIVEAAEDQEAQKMQEAKVVSNKIPAVPQKKRSERIQGPEYYYDFKGHYYFTTRLDKTKRYLRCMFPTCLAHTFMTLEDNAEIQPLSGSRPHNHEPDFTSKYYDKIKKWEEQLTDCLPSERLPSFRIQYCCYHDGKGFYYHQTSQSDNIRYLACAEPSCPVKAHMCTQKDSPITISSLRMGHSHNPDHTLREALLFIDAVRVRARSDNSPTSAISLETARNPVGAARVNLETLKLCLVKAAQIRSKESNEGITEDEVDFESCLKSPKTVQLKPSTESQVPVTNHFTSPRPILDDPQNKDKERSCIKSELVPALFSDSWLFHDGCGYYYNTKSINNGCRYLQCVLPKCGARALVGEVGGPVKLQKPHSHGPQPPQHRAELWFFHKIKTRAQNNLDTPLARIYKEVAQDDPEGAALMSKTEVLALMDKFLISVIQGKENENASQNKSSVFIPPHTPAETLPNWTFGRCQYHDGRGYYYTVNNSVKKPSNAIYRHLKCIARPTCSGRAFLVNGLVKISGSNGHNHKPDLIHRDICLFSYTLKIRARDEDTSVSVIYEEEAKNYPNAAAVLREDRLKRKLINIRKYVRREVNAQAEEEASEDSLNCTNQCVASEVFTTKAADVYHDGRGYYYHKTFTTNHERYLMCCEPHCLAQAKMGLRAGSPVVQQVGAPRHCHAPDPLRRHFLLLLDNIMRRAAQRNIKIETVLQEEATKEPIVAAQIPREFLINLIKGVHFTDNKECDLWALSGPYERLPSEHGWLYHDARGYYFYCHETYNSRRVLRCCEDGCEATAWLEDLRVTRAPGSVMHNHSPEPHRRSMLLLLHRMAIRAQHEHTSVTNIYEEEARLEPEGAALIPKNKLNDTLQNLAVSRYFKELEEEELCHKENMNEEKFSAKEVSSVSCEMLHSASCGKPVYHDNDGHYYINMRKTLEKQYVKCLMPLCDARGYLLLYDPEKLHIPVSWAEHNHPSDPRLRNKLLFIHGLRERALNNDTPVDVIYREERERDPVGAGLVSEVSIKTMLYKWQKSKSAGDNIDMFPYQDFTDDLTTEHIAEGIIEKVGEDIGHRDISDGTVEPAAAEVKVEMTEVAEDGDDEYAEEEYLEEERLEEEPVEEKDSMMSTDETSTWTGDVFLPSEKLPSRSHNVIYHNGQGYYFQINTVKDNNMYMRCTEPRCKVRGVKAADREDAPIIPTKDCNFHNHRPDFTRRMQLLFVQHCKERAATEINLTINEIWESEVARDPDMACQFSSHNVKAQMKRYRLEHAANSEIISKGKPLERSSEDGITFHDASITDPITENDSHVDIHQGAVPEKIPSLLGDTLWHAAGYFYSTYFYSTYDRSGSIEKVKCVEKECVARAEVTLGDRGQPLGIRLNKDTAHCHTEDLQRRDQLMFIDRCKRRAATTLQSVEEIYHDEAAMSPEVAAQLSAVRVKRAMGVAKKDKLKKGIRLDSKEAGGSAASGDHGMSELGEMANVIPPVEEAGASDSGAQDDSDYYNYEETLDDTDDLWTVDPKSLSREEKRERRKALARERQRRRRMRMMEDPDKWEQLQKDKESARKRALNWQRQKKTRQMDEGQDRKGQDDTDSEPKTTPKLGPKFLKERVKTSEEEEFQDLEELVDQTYSDYVTLEEELDSCEKELKNDVEEEEVGSGASASQIQGDFELEEAEPKNKKRSHLVHGRRVNSYSYHDGNGFFYDTQTISEKYRHLVCVVVGCKAQAYMPLDQEEGPINLTPQIPAHFHPPDPCHKDLVHFVTRCEARANNEEIPLKDIYDQEVELDPVSASKLVLENMLQRMLKSRNKSKEINTSATEYTPNNRENVMSENDEESGQALTDEENDTERSEVLPGYRPNSTIYHDMQGYYFIFNALKESKRYLRCIEPLCRVRGSMQLYDGAPIRTNPNIVHNHRPDFQRKNFVLFLQACKERAVKEDRPLARIYQEECDKDPVSATMISPQNMLQRMQRARKLTVQYYPTHEDQNEFSEACNSNTVTTNIPPHELVKEEDVQAQEEVDEYTGAETVIDEDDVVDEEEAAGDENREGDEDQQTEEVMEADSEYGQAQDSEAVLSIQAEGSEDSNTVYVYQSPYQQANYVDENGYYYQQTTVRNNTRYLKCAEAGCKARASMGLEEDSAITLSKQGCHHNHTADQSQLAMLLDIYTGEQVTLCHFKDEAESPKRPYRQRHKPELTIDPEEPPVDSSTVYEGDVTEDLAEGVYYHNEDQQRYPHKPSEVIPGLRPDANNYHDGNGFYYELNRLSPNIRYLKCLIKDCKARAYMELGKENAPIIQTNFARHNHGPDLSRKQFTVFLHRVTRRAAEEETPIHVIYQQEAERDPLSAGQIRMENVKQRMMRFRRKHRQGKNINQDASSASEMDMAGSIYHLFMEDEKPDVTHDKEEGVVEEEGEEMLYESYVVSEVEVESQHQQE